MGERTNLITGILKVVNDNIYNIRGVLLLNTVIYKMIDLNNRINKLEVDANNTKHSYLSR